MIILEILYSLSAAGTLRCAVANSPTQDLRANLFVQI